MNLTEEILDQIEKTLGIKLYEGQRQYLLNDGPYWFGDRGTGKTLAYCLKLALSEGKPLNINKTYDFCDQDYGRESNRLRYSKWFRTEFLSIWTVLKDNGFTVRALILR